MSVELVNQKDLAYYYLSHFCKDSCHSYVYKKIAHSLFSRRFSAEQQQYWFLGSFYPRQKLYYSLDKLAKNGFGNVLGDYFSQTHLVTLPCNSGSPSNRFFISAFRVQSRVARWYIFKTKIHIWVNFGGPCIEKVATMAVWNRLRPFETFWANLE
jgi:hypothetical protein